MKKKLAVIRDNEVKKCPFGLHVPDACFIAGNLVDNMVVIEPKDEDVGLTETEINNMIEANRRVLMFSSEKESKCKYANYIFKDKQMVECNQDDTGEGLGHGNFKSMPTSPQYLGISFYSIPVVPYNYNIDTSDTTTNILPILDHSFASVEDNKKD